MPRSVVPQAMVLLWFLHSNVDWNPDPLPIKVKDAWNNNDAIPNSVQLRPELWI